MAMAQFNAKREDEAAAALALTRELVEKSRARDAKEERSHKWLIEQASPTHKTPSDDGMIYKGLKAVSPPTPADLKRAEIVELRKAMANRPVEMAATDAEALTALYNQLAELEKATVTDIRKAMGSKSKADAAIRTINRAEGAHWRRVAETITDPVMKRAYLEKPQAIESEIP
jgi:hypothetical protein